MGNTNPFEIVFVVTLLVIMFMAAFAIVGPTYLSSINIDIQMPTPPSFPLLPNLNGQGNLSAAFPFSEIHEVTAFNIVSFSSFNPDKQVLVKSAYITLDGVGDGYTVERYNLLLDFIPGWTKEPIYTISGHQLSYDTILVPTIITEFDGANSTFIIDPNTNYACYIVFTPINGYQNMVDSWNVGHGFTVWMYGAAYENPGALEQVGAYLMFFANIVGFFVLYVWYAVQIMGIAGTLLGLNAAVGGGIAVLVIILFGGSMLMFLRGSSGSK